MHKIISTTGAPIEFTLTSDKNFVIDPVNPIEVTDEELKSLQERLGGQISVVSDEESELTEEEIAAKEQADKEAADAEAAEKAAVDASNASGEGEVKTEPILKNYKVLDEAGVVAPDGSTVEKDGVVELDALDENTISLLTAGAIEEEIPQV